ncbi:MAG: hypothetical protein ABI963_06880 [Rhizomicrobium sp.]
MLNAVTTFLRTKYPYLLGFCAIEAGIYLLEGPSGEFTTGFLGLFAIWIVYVLTSGDRGTPAKDA